MGALREPLHQSCTFLMLPHLRSFVSLFTSYGLLILANGLLTTLLGLRAMAEGFGTRVTGLMMALYFLGMFLGAMYAGRVVRRAGHIRAFAAFASLLSISPLIYTLWPVPAVWSLFRLMDGWCLAGLFMVTESWLNDRADNASRGSVLALYMVVNYMAYGAAQLLLPVWDLSTFNPYAICAAFFSLSVIPLLMTRAIAPDLEHDNGIALKHVLSRAPVGFWGAACAGIVSASFFSMAPVFADGMGFSTTEVSYFMAAGILGGLALQIPLGKLSDRMERRVVISAVATASALCSALIVLQVKFSPSLVTLMVSAFLFGSLALTLYSLSAAHANDWCDPDKRARIAATLLIGYGGGAVVGPLMTALFMGWLGPVGLFVFIAACCIVLAGYAFHLSRVRENATEKVSFVPQPSPMPGPEELYMSVQEQADPVPDPAP